MTSNPRRWWLVLIVACSFPASAHAQSRTWLAGVNYESPQLFAPVLVLHSVSDSGHEWNLWITGWTAGVDRSVVRGPRKRLQLLARVTPIHANGGNYIYVKGIRDPAAAFSAASLEIAAGLEVRHASRWTGSYRAIALYEHLGTTLPTLPDSWSHPFAGVEAAHSYTRIQSESLFGARWQGFKAEGSIQAYAGDRAWSRARATAGAGKRLGALFLSGRAAAYAGRSLDVVSAFLIGGSWDLGPPDMLAGYRYGEFRITKGMTLRGGADVRLHGAWELGVRGSYLAGSDRDRWGAAIQTMTVWNGAVIQAGVALPVGALPRDVRRPTVVFGSITAALVQR